MKAKLNVALDRISRYEHPVCSEINSRKILMFLSSGFAGIVTAVAAWSIWGGDLFPADKEPTGGE